MGTENKENELGALWVRKGPKGDYMTGTLTINGVAVEIVCFLNKFKKEARHPDWRILRAQPRQEQPKQQNRPPEREDFAQSPDDEINPDDIPF